MKKGLEYAILTDEITKAWAQMSSRDITQKIQTVSGKLKKLSWSHFCELISITALLKEDFTSSKH